jgi:hypothetical protein
MMCMSKVQHIQAHGWSPKFKEEKPPSVAHYTRYGRGVKNMRPHVIPTHSNQNLCLIVGGSFCLWINDCALHLRMSNQKLKLDNFLKTVAWLLSHGCIRITQQSPPNPAGRLLGRQHFAYRIPTTELGIQGGAQCMQTKKSYCCIPVINMKWV